MKRKDFLKSAAALGIGSLALGTNRQLFAETNGTGKEVRPLNGKFELPLLPYAYNAMEPYIDAQTMEIHHKKHHQAYINKLNEAIDKESALKGKSLDELLIHLQAQPEGVRQIVRNHGGGHWNHTFFWNCLKTGTTMGESFKKAATDSFGSVEAFKTAFEKAGLGQFGSGWVWLIREKGILKIVSTPNQDNPMMDTAALGDKRPEILLGCDVWEHAYYLKYQNKRADYLSNFWNVINWDEIEAVIKK